MVFSTLRLSLILVSVFTLSSFATPLEYPEVVPGPGFPTLASLGVTTKDLYERPYSRPEQFRSSEEETCNDGGETGLASIRGVMACTRYLKKVRSRGWVPRGPYDAPTLICSSGKTYVHGANLNTNTSSNWDLSCWEAADIVRSLLWACADASGGVAGYTLDKGYAFISIGSSILNKSGQLSGI